MKRRMVLRCVANCLAFTYLLFACPLFQGVILAQQGAGVAPVPPADAAQVQNEIQGLEVMLGTIPDRGPALFLLAHDYAHLGSLEKAFALLRECVSLDEGFDPEGDPAFDPLKKNPDYQKLIEGVHRKHPPVHRARVVISVQEKDLIPEGLAVNPHTGIFYMGSLHLGKIVAISKSKTVTDFVRTGQYDSGPVCGVRVDPANSDVWAAVCPDDGVKAELLHFDRSGKLLERLPPPATGGHLFNDLVLRGAGEVYLTDSLANRAYRFDRQSHRFTELQFPRSIIYPNGIALSDDGNLLFVADAFGILQVDLRTNSARELNPGPSNTLSGADGLYWYRNSLVAVQNSLGSSRIAQFHLTPDGLKVTKTTILEYRSPMVKLPTTGAISGSNFYFMTDTQLDNVKDGKIIDPGKLKPVEIAIVKLLD